MSLRTKTLIAVLVIFTTLAGLIYLAANTIVGQIFESLEQEQVQFEVERTVGTLDDELRNLSRTTLDYAAWDDTYNFISDRNEAYIESNLGDGTLSANRFSLVVFLDNAGATVFCKVYDLATEQVAPPNDPLCGLVAQTPRLRELPDLESSVEGLLLTPDGLLLTVARPILTSEYEGPARGTLIIGRLFDDAELTRLGEALDVRLVLQRLDRGELEPDFAAALVDLASGPSIVVRPSSEQTVMGHTLLRGIIGEEVALLSIETERSLYAQGHLTIRYLVLALLAIGAALSLVVAMSLEKSVLARLIRLSQSLSAVGRGGDIGARVVAEGNDEISALAHDINQMLAALAHTQQVAEVAMREAKEAAEAASKAKSTFLATMSHELRTPLTAILGYTDLLILQAERSAPHLLSDLDHIRNSGAHLLSLINDVLDLSKIEAGRMSLFVEPCLAEALIEEVVDTIRPLAEKGGNAVEVRLAEDLPTMYTDATKVRQILINLATNACKFTSEGRVLIAATPIELADGPGIAFEVADSGIGISPEQISKLFQDFQQADPMTPRRYGGTGLGLALSRRLCRLLGGEIVVASAPGVGSSFSFALPAVLNATTQVYHS